MLCIGSVALALLLPDDVGSLLLGATWQGARTLLLPVAAVQLAGAIILVLGCALRARGRVAAGARARLATAPLALVALSVGALVGGPSSALWGLAGSYLIGVALYLAALRGDIRRVGTQAAPH